MCTDIKYRVSFVLFIKELQETSEKFCIFLHYRLDVYKIFCYYVATFRSNSRNNQARKQSVMKTIISLEIETANAVVDFSRAIVAVGNAGIQVLNGTYGSINKKAAKVAATKEAKVEKSSTTPSNNPRLKFGWRYDVQQALKQYGKTIEWLGAKIGYSKGTMRNYIYSNTHCSKKAHARIMAAINELNAEPQPTA